MTGISGRVARVVVIHGPAELTLELMLLESGLFPVLYSLAASVWVPENMVPAAGEHPKGNDELW